MKILHIIAGLNQGGAEGTLCRLIQSDSTHQHCVISLLDEGVHGAALHANGVPVYTIGMHRGRPSLKGFLKLVRTIKSIQPDIVQTWMCHADLLGGLAARIVGSGIVVWGIRNTLLESKNTSLSTRLVVRLSALLSPFLPSAIVSCSTTAAQQHIRIGYDAKKMVIIPNGIDFERFRPNLASRAAMRTEISLMDDVCLFGMVARYDPQKDHKNLLLALHALLDQSTVPWKCIFVGQGMDSPNTLLQNLIDDFGLTSRVLLLGSREDIPRIMNGLDCHVLSSAYGEGFPNVVAEAMACGVPCVATDVGAAHQIIGDTGWVVPPRDEISLAAALAKVLHEYGSDRWNTRREQAQRSIQQNFSLDRMRETFHKLWGSLEKLYKTR